VCRGWCQHRGQRGWGGGRRQGTDAKGQGEEGCSLYWSLFQWEPLKVLYKELGVSRTPEVVCNGLGERGQDC
jgi:hypothetical protein